MDCISTRLPYRQTGAFNKIILDYIDQVPALRPFFAHPPTMEGIREAIRKRESFATNRTLLVEVLRKQYEGVPVSDATRQNIEALQSAQTFAITTAHQNNLFTGPLYFIYKILHAIRLAARLNEANPGKKFVPVFYIGTEDADLEELNHVHMEGEKLVWQSRQTGAVGRMIIDRDLLSLIDRMEGQLLVHPHGREWIGMLRKAFVEGDDIQTATFRLVNELFSSYGLVILLPDNPLLKRQMLTQFRDELQNRHASGIVEESAARLAEAGYKVQAHPRDINLFYLDGNIRERLEEEQGRFKVVHTDRWFSREELLQELENHPERFSPNVILRGMYQETILPNIAFIGGGGETAYWLQFKSLFSHYEVPFPVLVLRNSFLLVEKKWQERIGKLGFSMEDIFLTEREMVNKLVARDSKNLTRLNGTLPELEKMYEGFKRQASAVDRTLEKHVEALKVKTVYRLQELEKKMLRAEKRKFADQQRQIESIKNHLFPHKGLQERYENIGTYYARWGREMLSMLFEHSQALEQEFVVLGCP